MVIPAGQWWRRSQAWTGYSAMTTMRARNAGPISQAVARIPASTRTAAPAPSSITSDLREDRTSTSLPSRRCPGGRRGRTGVTAGAGGSGAASRSAGTGVAMR